jgi:hypothetical protein
MKKKNIVDKINWLLALNQSHSEKFILTRSARQLYRKRFPTEIIVFKCSDGRVFISKAAGMPLGIVRPYRNIGGHFDLGWHSLNKDLKECVDHGIDNGRKSLILITYHYSQSDKNLGCAGFECDCEAAFAAAVRLHQQTERFFGRNNQVVFPVVVGLETDTQSLIFHPQDPVAPRAVTCSDRMSDEHESLLEIVHNLYPDMDKDVKNDLLRLMKGNIAHVGELKQKGQDLSDMCHQEFVVGIGEGFAWLDEPNIALIIGPFHPDLSKPISKAIEIIKENMASGRANNDGFLVLASAKFKEEGADKNSSREKANFLRRYAKEIIRENYPGLLSKAKFMAVIVDERTRRLEQVPDME